MSNWIILAKRILKNPWMLLPVVVIIYIIAWNLHINYVVEDNYDPFSNVRTQNKVSVERTQYWEKELQNPQLDSERRKVIQEDLKRAEAMKNVTEKILTSYNQKNYSDAYAGMKDYHQLFIESINQDKEMYQNSGKDLIRALNNENTFYDYLSRENIEHDSLAPLQGITFAYTASSTFLPIVWAVVLVFIFSILFSTHFSSRLLIYRLVPVPFARYQFENLSIAILLGVLLILGSLVFSISLAGGLNSWGSIHYPVLFYSKDMSQTWLPIIDLLGESICYIFLGLLVMIVTVYAIHFYVKDLWYTLILALLIGPGSMVLTEHNKLVSRVGYFLPFNYLRGAQLASREFFHYYRAPIQDISVGIVYTLVYCLLLLSFVRIVNRRRDQLLIRVK